jgi:hypothetical protein
LRKFLKKKRISTVNRDETEDFWSGEGGRDRAMKKLEEKALREKGWS